MPRTSQRLKYPYAISSAMGTTNHSMEGALLYSIGVGAAVWDGPVPGLDIEPLS